MLWVIIIWKTFCFYSANSVNTGSTMIKSVNGYLFFATSFLKHYPTSTISHLGNLGIA